MSMSDGEGYVSISASSPSAKAQSPTHRRSRKRRHSQRDRRVKTTKHKARSRGRNKRKQRRARSQTPSDSSDSSSDSLSSHEKLSRRHGFKDRSLKKKPDRGIRQVSLGKLFKVKGREGKVAAILEACGTAGARAQRLWPHSVLLECVPARARHHLRADIHRFPRESHRAADDAVQVGGRALDLAQVRHGVDGGAQP